MKGVFTHCIMHIALLKDRTVLMWLVEMRFPNLKEYSYRNYLSYKYAIRSYSGIINE